MKLVQATREYGCSLCPRPIKFAEMHYVEDGVRTHKHCHRLRTALQYGAAKPGNGKAVR